MAPADVSNSNSRIQRGRGIHAHGHSHSLLVGLATLAEGTGCKRAVWVTLTTSSRRRLSQSSPRRKTVVIPGGIRGDSVPSVACDSSR
eukprot:CAMPEP_0115878184 /NCGR_PEP_ID=MMETSP0287-20121206/26636_1 /TAXON_ID=412157 /ORGANISM="Chrysochromulina rotalis, Strain UIO044" /LENGTH=87 /DNA_ID=CAMNT_0003333779 /DNA_START=29 /DNA_END=289 /DNA_ORIENTATION=-